MLNVKSLPKSREFIIQQEPRACGRKACKDFHTLCLVDVNMIQFMTKGFFLLFVLSTIAMADIIQMEISLTFRRVQAYHMKS